MYKLILDPLGIPVGKIGCILRLSDKALIPLQEDNRDYQIYLKWLDGYEYDGMIFTKVSDGNEPLPPDAPVNLPEPTEPSVLPPPTT